MEALMPVLTEVIGTIELILNNLGPAGTLVMTLVALAEIPDRYQKVLRDQHKPSKKLLRALKMAATAAKDIIGSLTDPVEPRPKKIEETDD